LTCHGPKAMKRFKSRPNRWQDHWSRQAKKDKYPARSVYKLEEIQRKYRVIRKGATVLDLGCAPGSWLLFAARAAGKSGKILGIDLQEVKVELLANVTALVGDIFEPGRQVAELLAGTFDTVISDMAPATTGNKTVDAARSLELCRRALEIARRRLRPGGNFVCKIFQGAGFKDFTIEVKRSFEKQHNFKPRSSRKASKEIFVIGLGRRRQEN